MNDAEINNITGWLVKAIEENYQKPTSKKSNNKIKATKNKFNDFQQRNYSDDEIADLEKKLLSK